MSTFFQFIYRISKKYTWIFILIVLVVFGYSAYLASKLKFSEDISRILPESEKISKLNFVMSNAKFMDNVIFNIRLKDSTATDPDLLNRFADQLKDSLIRYIPDYLQSIEKPPGDAEMLKIYDVIYEHLPLFLEDEDYKKIDSMITEENIDLTLESNYRNLISPMGMGTKKMIARDPLHFTPLAMEKLRSFQLSDNMIIHNGHFMTKDKRNLLLIITPVSTNNTAANRFLFNRIDDIIFDLTGSNYNGITVSYFGSPVVSLGNAQRIKSDIFITVSVAMVLLILFITLFFRRKRTFLIILLPVAFGGIVSIASLYLLKNEVSAISLGIGSVLLGITLDYALHIFSHFRKHHDVIMLLRDLSTPVMMSSITTAGAFFSLRFVNSQALNDLGMFASIAVLAAAFFSLLVLPHLLPAKKTKQHEIKHGFIDRISKYPFAGKKSLQIIILLVTIVFLFLWNRVGFESDMMKNNYMRPELMRAEQDLNEITNLGKKTIYLVIPGTDLDEALKKNDKIAFYIDSLKQKGIIQDATVVSDFFHSASQQKEAFKRWGEFWNSRKENLVNNLIKYGTQYKFKASAFQKLEKWLNADFKPVDPGEIPILSELYLNNYTLNTDTLSAVINVLKVNTGSDDVNTVLNFFETKPLTWVIDKRVITSEFVGILKDNFNKLIVISLLIVFTILLLSYGRIELTIITMIPIFFSWVWVVGIMAVFGISFNIFNVIILTFIFGLGIDYSIFIIRGLLQEHKYGHEDISSYKVSVILSGITTLLGIGVLIFAKHPALQSIAAMSIIGILSVIFITFTLLPAIFNWMVNYKKGKRNRPVTLLDLLFSVMSLFIFVGGALLMSLFSFILKILPGSTKKKKYIFHIAFSKLTWFLIYANFLSPKRIINPKNEDYSKPAIIIANHQSHIDLMLMMLLNPKVLILTNRRNYTHPFYGKALQYADFLPSDIGYDEIAEDLKSLIVDGYSFMIFPEGHRNDDGFIKRFHKGAFYLAEKLRIDILPIIIHGQNQLLKKSEFFLKRGSIHTKFLPRIDLSKKEYGETLRDQTKGINKWFRKEYAAVREEYETPDYWADYIIKSFIYKGPVLEWYTRIKLRLEKNYHLFNELVPRNCTITDLGCGFGYLDFMLSLVSEGRTIKAFDYDEDKIEVARNCSINNERIDFQTADITRIELEQADVFILNDVLHYLPQNQQVNTVEKCIKIANPGGMIIIRDSDKDLKKRHFGTRLTEFFSTNFGFNKTGHKLEFVSRQMIEEIASQNSVSLEVIDDTTVTSNLVYILRKIS